MIHVKGVINKIKNEVVLVIGDTRHVLEYFLKTFIKKPLVGGFLNFNKVGHIDYFVDFTKAHSLGVAKLYGFDIYHRLITP